MLDDDIVTDGEPEAGALAGRFRREERGEHLFLDLGRNTGAVIADRDLHPVAEVFGSRRKSRLVAIAVGPRFPFGRRIEAVRDQV